MSKLAGEPWSCAVEELAVPLVPLCVSEAALAMHHARNPRTLW